MRLFYHVGLYQTSILSRDKWQMNTGRKSTNYWKSGRTTLFRPHAQEAKAPIYPNLIDDIKIDPEMEVNRVVRIVGTMNNYHSLFSPLSLLDRYYTEEEDYERYCVARFAAELEEEPEEEPDSQDREEKSPRSTRK